MSRTAVSSATLASSKRSASVAGVEASAGSPGSKRQRVEKDATETTTQSLTFQANAHVAKKFSGSFSVSHILNLHVMGENQYVRKWLHQLTWVSR